METGKKKRGRPPKNKKDKEILVEEVNKLVNRVEGLEGNITRKEEQISELKQCVKNKDDRISKIEERWKDFKNIVSLISIVCGIVLSFAFVIYILDVIHSRLPMLAEHHYKLVYTVLEPELYFTYYSVAYLMCASLTILVVAGIFSILESNDRRKWCINYNFFVSY